MKDVVTACVKKSPHKEEQLMMRLRKCLHYSHYELDSLNVHSGDQGNLP